MVGTLKTTWYAGTQWWEVLLALIQQAAIAQTAAFLKPTNKTVTEYYATVRALYTTGGVSLPSENLDIVNSALSAAEIDLHRIQDTGPKTTVVLKNIEKAQGCIVSWLWTSGQLLPGRELPTSNKRMKEL